MLIDYDLYKNFEDIDNKFCTYTNWIQVLFIKKWKIKKQKDKKLNYGFFCIQNLYTKI